MTTFTPSLLPYWKSSGYRFIHVLPRNKYGVLRPLLEDRAVRFGYTIEITELPLLQITEEYFLTKDKDSLPSMVDKHNKTEVNNTL
jgi:hypothetical protein